MQASVMAIYIYIVFAVTYDRYYYIIGVFPFGSVYARFFH